MMRDEKINQRDNPLVGSNIRRLRIQNKMRNVDVTTKLQLLGLEVGTSTLSKIERGTSNPTVDIMIALAEILHCDYNAFFFGAKLSVGEAEEPGTKRKADRTEQKKKKSEKENQKIEDTKRNTEKRKRKE